MCLPVPLACLSLYAHTHTHTHTHTYTYILVYICIYVYIHTCIHTYIHTYSFHELSALGGRARKEKESPNIFFFC